jgi:hypothetical protein
LVDLANDFTTGGTVADRPWKFELRRLVERDHSQGLNDLPLADILGY